ncbi:hypothetical protein GCM10007989_02730 [Devosia pacifica]|uniref:Holin n=1 Tax=Devosia pacifica TaxID=1335967 RepID=A0A918RX07_9HYPH|nr:hypothetical protein [Devosia pacifica]GHA11844.1 hypothetical protein GCM10007989_02730 [Devosia pacifica]
MTKQIRENVLIPVLTRAGTAAAAYLVAQGMPADSAHQVAIAVTAIGLVMADLFAEWVARRSAK